MFRYAEKWGMKTAVIIFGLLIFADSAEARFKSISETCVQLYPNNAEGITHCKQRFLLCADDIYAAPKNIKEQRDQNKCISDVTAEADEIKKNATDDASMAYHEQNERAEEQSRIQNEQNERALKLQEEQVQLQRQQNNLQIYNSFRQNMAPVAPPVQYHPIPVNRPTQTSCSQLGNYWNCTSY